MHFVWLVAVIIMIKITMLLTVARSGYWWIAPIIAVIMISHRFSVSRTHRRSVNKDAKRTTSDRE